MKHSFHRCDKVRYKHIPNEATDEKNPMLPGYILLEPKGDYLACSCTEVFES